jgi:hypothetical protein
MSSLQELYGDNFVNDIKEHNQQYVAGLAVSNLAALNFKEVKHDFSSLFDPSSNQLSTLWFNYIKSRTEKLNPFLLLDRITNLNAIPRIINEPQITYLRIIDNNRKNVYILFITPFIIDVF